MHARTQVMEKRHIRRENKVKQVLTEKHVLSRVAHEFVVKLWFTFQVRTHASQSQPPPLLSLCPGFINC